MRLLINEGKLTQMSGYQSVSLVLVTYNRAELLDKILGQIRNFHWDYSHFVVINNASTDQTKDIIEKYEEVLHLEVLTLDSNIGHGAGLATGLEFLSQLHQNPEYVVFLEDDSIPEKKYLDELLSRIQGTSFSMVSSAGYRVRLGKRLVLHPKSNEVLEADFALFDGAIALFKDLKSVGFPVKDWFMMFDDFEYCYRIRKAGYKIGVFDNSSLTILHEGWGGGTSHSSLWRSYYQSRNYVHFVRMHFSWFNLLDFLILQSKRMIGGLFIKNGLKSTKYRLMGLRAGLQGKKGVSLDIRTLKEVY